MPNPQLLTDKSRLQEIYDLRVEAYEHSPKSVYVNRKIFPNGWFDNLDNWESTRHWVVTDNDKIIAAARITVLNVVKDTGEDFDKFELPGERPFAYWSRLVVHPEYRKTSAMLKIDHARKRFMLDNPQVKFALCCVTPDRSKSLLRIGFNHLGEFMYNWGGRIEQVVSAYIFL